MTSHLNKIDFDSITFPEPSKAVVKTREVWDFAYTDVKTGMKKKGEEQKDFEYLMTYTVEKKDGRWIITDAAASEEKPKERSKPRKIDGDRKQRG